MGDANRKYVAATSTAEAGEVQRRTLRDRGRRMAVYSSLAVLLVLGAFLVVWRTGVFEFSVKTALPGDTTAGRGSGQPASQPSGQTPGQSPAAPAQGEGDNGDSASPADSRAPLEKALKAKGLYLTMDTAGTPSRMAYAVTYIRQHQGLNSMVIDVKDNSGRVPCDPPDSIPAVAGGYGHFPALVRVLHDEGYYMIARIVAFQDPYRAETIPERAIRNTDGSLWYDRDGRLWLNPYDRQNWDYVRDIALWALGMGFDEIQLDYVRFPDSARGLETSGAVLMPGSTEYSTRGEAIAAFLKYLDKALDKKAYLSADIFGFTTIAADDMGIGQKLEEVAGCVDFICPMVYPSHYYNAGIYGFQQPEAHPYEVVSKAMDQILDRTKGLRSKVRPWLQDFSMKISYGPEEVRSQITAVLEHDIETFMLWNPANTYTEGVSYVK
jgi:hypothetical protein